jgi:hypothetical protein
MDHKESTIPHCCSSAVTVGTNLFAKLLLSDNCWSLPRNGLHATLLKELILGILHDVTPFIILGIFCYNKNWAEVLYQR